MDKELEIVGSYTSEAEANICKATLAAENIPAVILRDDAGGMDPQLQLTQGVRLMVRRSDLELAREILGSES